MRKIVAMNKIDDIETLKSFIDDNEDLEQLESILDRFNIFESLGLVRQEIRHSAFLRWLLDPAETHGLGDYWLRRFLKMVIKGGEEKPGNRLSLFDLDGWDLSQAEVRKEWNYIDLLIVDNRNMFVCVIENKVDSSEHSDQLNRYKEIVEREFEDHKKVYVLLTVSGAAPSNPSYISVAYKDLVWAIETALRRRASQVNDAIMLFVQHYVDMVRRRIVEDSEIQEICRKLYKNHGRALDLIFEHRNDRQAEVGRVIRDYILSLGDEVTSIVDTTTLIKFLPKHMDLPQIQHDGKPILAWQLVNKGREVQFDLQLRPGPEEMRQRIYEVAQKHPDIFGRTQEPLSKDFPIFFSETWIARDEYYALDDEEIKQKICKGIDNLLEVKGEGMTNALKKLL